MTAPTLVVMAAGIGSRYGGLKQVDPLGPGGEILMDYALYDAVRAGFGSAVFVIKREMEALFREKVGRHAERVLDTHYAFQALEDVPRGFAIPEGRVKPWGTAHAVLAARHAVKGPFAAINGDDFYGRTAFQAIGDFLRTPEGVARQATSASEPQRFAMVGYPVENTVTDHGTVARGVCTTDPQGRLVNIVERTRIRPFGDAIRYTDDNEHWHDIPRGTPVSMNMWGFPRTFMDDLEAAFPQFLAHHLQDPLKSECFLPAVVDQLLKAGRATVQVLPTQDRWFGVTYQEDRPVVQSAITQLIQAGHYPAHLWEV